MEMRRRALESMARGRLEQPQRLEQQNLEKKIIVPLNEDSSSGWILSFQCAQDAGFIS